MKYIIYKITNIIDGKVYIGKHQTKNVDDGYMGSGKHLRRAIKKYGKENFVKEILHIFMTEEEMNSKETELVTEEFCLREDTYNICVGGHGGFSHINRDMNNRVIKNKKARTKTDEILKSKYGVDNPSQIDFVKEKASKRMIKMWSEGKMPQPPSFLGKTHSIETKRIMSESRKGKCVGINNSQYGSVWITNGSCNKKIKNLDTIPDGWYRGRVK